MKRSEKFELLDEIGHSIAQEDLYRNLDELKIINTYLGGHKSICTTILNYIQKSNKRDWVIAEIGSGGGDNLQAILNHPKLSSYNITLIGVDLKEDCIRYAKKNTDQSIHYIQSSFESAELPKVDIVFSSLFMHHMNDQQSRAVFQWMLSKADFCFFSDLRRSRWAVLAIQLLTLLFSKSYLVKNDAPLSVKRSRTTKEWIQLLNESKCIAEYKYFWANRQVISFKTQYQ